MSADKRSVHTDALETLGNILVPGKESRDAIHLAVEPVEAAHSIRPGQDVGYRNGKASPYFTPHVGIADPFIKGPIKDGDTFWLVIYPRQITSLRHVWAHPAFDAETKVIVSAEQIAKENAMARVLEFCDCIDVEYDELMRNAQWHQEDDWHYWCEGERFDGVYLYDEFWHDYQLLTGKAAEKDGSFFSCSC